MRTLTAAGAEGDTISSWISPAGGGRQFQESRAARSVVDGFGLFHVSGGNELWIDPNRITYVLSRCVGWSGYGPVAIL